MNDDVKIKQEEVSTDRIVKDNQSENDKNKSDTKSIESDYKKEIKENIAIYNMPKNVDRVTKGKKVESGFVSTEQIKQNQEGLNVKIVGAVIIISGLLVLIGGSYLGYVYLIKPYSENGKKVVTVDKKNINKQKAIEKNNNKKTENKTDKIDSKISKKNTIVKDNAELNNKNNQDNKANAENKLSQNIIPTTTIPITTNSTTSGNMVATTSSNKVSTSTVASTINIDNENKVSTTTKAEKALPVVADSDKDGLFDVEETLFGTNLNLNDTDGDGYGDKEEVLALYDPDGPGKITNNKNIDIYSNVEQKYKVFYPKKWNVTALDESRTLMFLAPNRAYISIIVQKNINKKSVEDWYREQFAGEDSGVLESIKNDNWHGVKNAEGTIYYISPDSLDNIYTLSFTRNSDNVDINYTNVLRMMVNSFEFIK